MCHRNKTLEDKIKSSPIHSRIDLRTLQVSDLDMGIIIQMAIIDRQCTELELQGKQITDRGISILVHSLHDNTSMTKLNLSHNPITDVGVELLANLLSKNRTRIEKLYLSDTEISDQGIDYLADMLTKNTTLTSLGIFQNQLTDRGIQRLANVLATHNTSIKRLYLQSNRLVTDASVNDLIEMIMHNESLIGLDVKECGLTTTGIKRLRQATNGKNFDLTC
ncbi:unnamed protein product [Rotaria sp. Silwood1]|nr:unnamed protein product [Rotaria sp. Silwood1]